jgi:hypothetical protein
MRRKLRSLARELGAGDIDVSTYGFTEAKMAWGNVLPARPAVRGYHLYPDLGIRRSLTQRAAVVPTVIRVNWPRRWMLAHGGAATARVISLMAA